MTKQLNATGCTLAPVANCTLFADCSYKYYPLEVDGTHTDTSLVDRTLMCVDGQVAVNGVMMQSGDSIHLINVPCVYRGAGTLFVAEVSASAETKFAFTKAGDHYTVVKPWGYEMWVNGDYPLYCFKKIFIKAGTQTSLQYHNFKEETNVILVGKAVLVYKHNDSVANDDVAIEDLSEYDINEPSFIHVMPKTIHRLRAVTDMYLYEVSTPYLDDVIRLHDDARRANGRIEEEHRK